MGPVYDATVFRHLDMFGRIKAVVSQFDVCNVLLSMYRTIQQDTSNSVQLTVTADVSKTSTVSR